MARSRRSLDALMRPQSVVVVGASPNPSFVSMALKNLLRYGYSGEVAAVNPKHERVEGAPCYPSLAEVPFDVDLVVVGIAERYVPALLDQAEARGVGALEVITSGYAETGPEGARRPAAPAAGAE